MTELKKLNLPGNRLTLEYDKSGVLQNMKNLEILNLDNNKITNIKAINKLDNLKHLYLLSDNNIVELKQIEDIISNLDLLKVSTESLKTILNCDEKDYNIKSNGKSINRNTRLIKINKIVKK